MNLATFSRLDHCPARLPEGHLAWFILDTVEAMDRLPLLWLLASEAPHTVLPWQTPARHSRDR
jgi:hypothetical protein